MMTMNKILTLGLVILLGVNSVEAKASKKKGRVGTKQHRQVKTSKRASLKSTRVFKEQPRREKSPPGPPLVMDMEAYNLNSKKQINYEKAKNSFKEHTGKLVSLLPQCIHRNLFRDCLQKLLFVQQWINSFLENERIKKCKYVEVREELNILSKLLVSKVRAAAEYSEVIIKKMEKSNPRYYLEVEEQAKATIKKLPSCF